MKVFVCLLAVIAFLTGSAFAQPVISAKSGLVNYTEGKALVDGRELQLKFAAYPQIPQGSELRTEEGRAEVLLGPGVFLRVGENSALRMVSTSLVDAKVDFETGSAILECADLPKDAQLVFSLKGATISILKDGVYRLDGAPASLRVYDGEARVTEGGQSQTVRGGRMLALEGVSAPEKFDSKTGDALYRWAKRRAEYLAMANVSAAKYVHEHDLSYASNSWVWNPWYGSYTFLPVRGAWRSFWGYEYYSPVRFYAVFQAPRVQPPTSNMGTGYQPNYGYSVAPQTSAGTSGTVAASAPATAAAQTTSAPIAATPAPAGGRTR
jgi:hypothetical protein